MSAASIKIIIDQEVRALALGLERVLLERQGEIDSRGGDAEALLEQFVAIDLEYAQKLHALADQLIDLGVLDKRIYQV
jgi:hypothetical protein